MTDISLAVLIFGPLAITFLLKSNAALSFLALCVGFVLSISVIGDLSQLLSQANLSVTDSTLAAILIVAPLVITLLLTRRTNTRGIKFWLQLTVALCAGGLLALSLGPVLNTSGQFDITNSRFWGDLQKIQSEIIGAGALLSLLLIWFKSLRKKGSKKHK
jgi:cytochrome bd-type quinol oxidase subunit 2